MVTRVVPTTDDPRINGVANLTELRALATNDQRGQVLMHGSTAAGDWLARVYRWDAASTAADTGADVVRPDNITSGNPGRWIESPLANRPASDPVDTIADLRIFPYAKVKPGEVIHMLAYAVPDDGGAGFFRWDASAAKSFSAADVNDLFTVTAHGWKTGQVVRLYGSLGGSGLSANTDYYVTNVTTNTFKLASSPENAFTGSAVVAVTANVSGTVNIGDDNGTTVVPTANVTNTGRWIRLPGNGEFNACAFGLRSGQAANQIPYINRAIFAAGARGGGTVWLPDGDYEVWPEVYPSVTAGAYIKMVDRVTVRGSSPFATRIYVRNSNGNYTQIISGITDIFPLNHIEIKDIRIDCNVPNVQNVDIGTHPNYAFSFISYDVRNARFSNIHFDTCTGMNTLDCHEDAFNDGNVEVRDCYFNWQSSPAPTLSGDYDNSCIYISNLTHKVIGCDFDVVSTSFKLARGAIETHGVHSVIANNTSDGYETLCNAVTQIGATEKVPNDLAVVGNTARRSMNTIQLWAADNRPMRNVLIEGNTLSVTQVDHDSPYWGAIQFNDGGGTTLKWDGIRIAENTIYMQDESAAGRTQTTTAVPLSTSLQHAISTISNGTVENIDIENNTIVNAPVAAIRIGSTSHPTRNVNVRNNTIVNSGTNIALVDGNGNPVSERAAIRLAYELHDVTVEGNKIISTQASLKGWAAFTAYPTSGSKRVKIRRNEVAAKQGDYRYDVDATLVEHDFYRRIDTAGGIEFHTSATNPPSTGRYGYDDFIWFTGDWEPGTAPLGWKVWNGGVLGTLSGVTVSSINTTANRITLSAGGGNNILTGDVLVINGNLIKAQAVRGDVLYYYHIFGTETNMVATNGVSYNFPDLQPFYLDPAPGASATKYPRWRNAKWYGAGYVFPGSTSQVAMSANMLYAVPVWIPDTTRTIDTVGLNLSVGAGTNLRLGLYTANISTDLPDALLWDTGNIASNTSGDKTFSSTRFFSRAGLHWLAVVCDGAPTAQTFTINTSIVGYTSLSDTTPKGMYSRAFTFATLPSTWGAISNELQAAPDIRIKAV